MPRRISFEKMDEIRKEVENTGLSGNMSAAKEKAVSVRHAAIDDDQDSSGSHRVTQSRSRIRRRDGASSFSSSAGKSVPPLSFAKEPTRVSSPTITTRNSTATPFGEWQIPSPDSSWPHQERLEGKGAIPGTLMTTEQEENEDSDESISAMYRNLMETFSKMSSSPHPNKSSDKAAKINPTQMPSHVQVVQREQSEGDLSNPSAPPGIATSDSTDTAGSDRLSYSGPLHLLIDDWQSTSSSAAVSPQRRRDLNTLDFLSSLQRSSIDLKASPSKKKVSAGPASPVPPSKSLAQPGTEATARSTVSVNSSLHLSPMTSFGMLDELDLPGNPFYGLLTSPQKEKTSPDMTAQPSPLQDMTLKSVSPTLSLGSNESREQTSKLGDKKLRLKDSTQLDEARKSTTKSSETSPQLSSQSTSKTSPGDFLVQRGVCDRHPVNPIDVSASTGHSTATNAARVLWTTETDGESEGKSDDAKDNSESDSSFAKDEIHASTTDTKGKREVATDEVDEGKKNGKDKKGGLPVCLWKNINEQPKTQEKRLLRTESESSLPSPLTSSSRKVHVPDHVLEQLYGYRSTGSDANLENSRERALLSPSPPSLVSSIISDEEAAATKRQLNEVVASLGGRVSFLDGKVRSLGEQLEQERNRNAILQRNMERMEREQSQSHEVPDGSEKTPEKESTPLNSVEDELESVRRSLQLWSLKEEEQGEEEEDGKDAQSVENLQKKLAQADEDLSNKEKQLKKTQQKAASLRADLVRLRESASSSTTTVENRAVPRASDDSNIWEELQREMDLLKVKWISVKSDRDQCRKSLDEKTKEMTTDRVRWDDERTLLEKKAASQEQEAQAAINELNTELRHCQSVMSESRSKWNNTEETMRHEIETYRHRVDELEKQLSDTASLFKADVAALRSKLSTACTSSARLTEEIQDLQEQLDKSKSLTTKLKEESNELSSQLLRVEAERDDLAREVTSFEQQLEERKATQKQASDDVEKLRHQLQVTKQTLAEKQAEIDDALKVVASGSITTSAKTNESAAGEGLSLRSKLSETVGMCGNLQVEVLALEESLSVAKVRLLQLQKERDEMRSLWSGKCADLEARLSEETADATRAVAELLSELEKSESKVEELTLLLTEAEENLHEEKKAKKQLDHEVEEAKLSLNEATSKLETKVEEENRMRHMMDSAVVKSDRLQYELADSKKASASRITELETVIEQLQNTFAQKQEENLKLAARVERVESDRAECMSLIEETQEAMELAKEREDEIADLRQRLAVFENSVKADSAANVETEALLSSDQRYQSLLATHNAVLKEFGEAQEKVLFLEEELRQERSHTDDNFDSNGMPLAELEKIQADLFETKKRAESVSETNCLLKRELEMAMESLMNFSVSTSGYVDRFLEGAFFPEITRDLLTLAEDLVAIISHEIDESNRKNKALSVWQHLSRIAVALSSQGSENGNYALKGTSESKLITEENCTTRKGPQKESTCSTGNNSTTSSPPFWSRISSVEGGSELHMDDLLTDWDVSCIAESESSGSDVELGEFADCDLDEFVSLIEQKQAVVVNDMKFLRTEVDSYVSGLSLLSPTLNIQSICLRSNAGDSLKGYEKDQVVSDMLDLLDINETARAAAFQLNVALVKRHAYQALSRLRNDSKQRQILVMSRMSKKYLLLKCFSTWRLSAQRIN